jgi:Rieske Fe-S protein
VSERTEHDERTFQHGRGSGAVNRRRLLASAALGLAAVTAGTVITPDAAFAAPVSPATAEDAPAPAADPAPVEPAGGAGVFDVDLDQTDVSQDPTVTATGDVAVMPDDWEF